MRPACNVVCWYTTVPIANYAQRPYKMGDHLMDMEVGVSRFEYSHITPFDHLVSVDLNQIRYIRTWYCP